VTVVVAHNNIHSVVVAHVVFPNARFVVKAAIRSHIGNSRCICQGRIFVIRSCGYMGVVFCLCNFQGIIH
jgi:hypothetical protein